MSLFCDNCRNLLTMVTTADTFDFKCNKCELIKEPKITDYKVYESLSGTNLDIFRSLLAYAGKDPVNPKVVKKCKCGNNIVKQVRLGNEMKLVNTCVKCNKQWLDGTMPTDLDGDDVLITGSGKKKVKKST